MLDEAIISQQPTANSPAIIVPLSKINHYEDFERERLDPIYDTINPYSDMAKTERYFMNGMIRALKPKKVLEFGVYRGGGSAIILNAISDIDGAELYSLDYAVESFDARDHHKLTGFLVEEKFPQFMNKWHIFRGGDGSRYIEAVGGDIDLLVLDTAHIHPWETLNFICVLPFMKMDSYVILHDITLHYLGMKKRNHLACRNLFGHVVSDEKFSPVSDYEGLPSNIGAFKVSANTVKYACNLFESLLIPWEAEVKPEDLETVSAIIKKYYAPELYEFFCDAVDFQKHLDLRAANEGIGFSRAFKNGIKAWNPHLFAFLRKVRHPFRKSI